MTAARSYLTILFALAIGAGYAATAPACVVQATDCDMCGEEGVCDSHFGPDMDGDGEQDCYCDDGHTWSDPNDSDNFDCDEIEPKPDTNACAMADNTVQSGGQCFCECGFNWCNPGDEADLSCCADDSQFCGDTDMPMTEDSSGDSSSGSSGSGSGSSGSDSGSSGSGSGSDSGSGSGETMAEESSGGSGSGSGSGG